MRAQRLRLDIADLIHVRLNEGRRRARALLLLFAVPDVI
jgi:hypothetical protein